jgi:hypothetical protein
MVCKYCHETTHYIDKCPTILCKICKEIGHPQWLCKKKKQLKTSKPSVSSEEQVYKNINHYLKIIDKPWSDI